MMKGKLIIGESADGLNYLTQVYEDEEPYGFSVIIDAPLEDDYNTLISKPYDFEESLSMDMQVREDNQQSIEFLKDFQKNRINYLNNIEYITFLAEPKEIAEYIRKNPILKTKKIVFDDMRELDPTLVNEISSAFGNETSNIYFNLLGNSELITFREYKDTIDKITTMINEIESYNFSPMEKIMYAYDIVRNKVYEEVDENQSKLLSRNLSSSLLGDKIVCVGYAIIFRTLLEKLGITCKELYLWHPDRKSGHARNVMYVKDDKYGIDGVYYFDPTWGSKKDENDKEYLYIYRFFGMTKKQMDEIDEGNYIDDNLPINPEDIVWKFEDKFDEGGWDKMPPEMINQINYMSCLAEQGLVINKAYISPFTPPALKTTKESVMDKLYDIPDYFDRPISAETMLQVLFNVRKIQYYTTPDKFPFGMNEFFKTVFMSHWDFENATEKERFIMEFVSPKEKGRIKMAQYARYAQSVDLPRQIEEIKLTRVLRNVYEEQTRKSR